MLIHYFKIAIRNLAKQKVLAFINVFGLSVGIACFSLFLLYAINEFSYDRFHVNGDRIFRMAEWWTGNKDHEPRGDAGTYLPLGPAMKTDLPNVENYMRFMGGGERFVKVDNTVSRVPVSFADPSMFNIFSFKVITGDADNVLKGLHNVVLTRDKAIQLFGKTDVVGKIINIKWDSAFEPFIVGGVVENIPNTSSIKFDVLGNFNYIYTTQDGKDAANNWHMTIGIETYVELKKNSDAASVSKQLISFRKKYYPDEEAQLLKRKIWDGKGPYPTSFKLQPLRNIHINPAIESGPQSAANPKNIWILVSIAAGILLIACINFTTLAIGRSAGRAKEVGVRKVIGSGRKQLISQFLTESVLLSIISGLFGLILANLLLPYFNQLSGKELQFSFSQFPQLTWMLIGLVLLVGILAGIYPALILSGFRVIEVLKSKIKLGGSNFFTKSLVTVQFVLSAGLIICTIIIMRQLHFLRSKNLGFNKENVIDISAFGADAKKIYPLFKQELQADPQMLGISASQMGLGEGKGEMNDRYMYKDKEFFPIKYPVDASYIDVIGMQIIAGRNFNRDISSDSVESVIINETLAKNELGLTPEDAIGKQLGEGWGGSKPQIIIGVVRDFNFEPLTRKVRSQLFAMPSDLDPVNFFVRVKAGDPSTAIAALQAAWKKSSVDLPFKYSFLDEDLDRFYKSEEKWSGIVGCAGTISIFLACLGLFGLAALSAVNRTKEIGIRKILGASIGTIVRLLSQDFLRLVIIALVIASPVAWYFMNKWLQDYAYRIDIGWLTFAITGLIALLVAFITIGFQAIKAATANPVKSLRTE